MFVGIGPDNDGIGRAHIHTVGAQGTSVQKHPGIHHADKKEGVRLANVLAARAYALAPGDAGILVQEDVHTVGQNGRLAGPFPELGLHEARQQI